MDEKITSKENILELELYKENDFLGYRWSNTDELLELNNLRDQNLDWAAFYTCLDYETAEGYLVNRLPHDGKGNGTVYMHKIFVKKDFLIVKCKDNGFRDGSYKMNKTTERIKRELREVHGIDVKDDDALLPRLGELGYSFRCFHDREGTVEIVIPHIMKADYLYSKLMRKYQYKKYCMVSKENKE